MNNKYTKELYHHGVLGMHWGIRRYQPYGHGGYKPDHIGKNVGDANRASADTNKQPNNKKKSDKQQKKFAKTLKKQAKLMKPNNREITNKSAIDRLAYMGPGQQDPPRLKTESFNKLDEYIKQRRDLRYTMSSEAYNFKYYPQYYNDKAYNKAKLEIQNKDKQILNELLGTYADMPLSKVSVYGDNTVGQLLTSVLKDKSGEKWWN